MTVRAEVYQTTKSVALCGLPARLGGLGVRLPLRHAEMEHYKLS